MERRKHQTHPPPPPTLNVKEFAESRAPELHSLHSVVSNRLNNNFKSQNNKRRRTTSFNKRSGKKRKEDNTDKTGTLLLPRKVRRRIELRKNLDTGFSTSGDGTRRLPTHLWHAKRFQMIKKWGFYLPLGLPGRGKGSRALLKWFRRGTLVHDSSYNTAIQLEGPQDTLLSILRMVLVPTPSIHPDEPSTSMLSGNTCARGMLHHVGAPFSQLISPVIYMWRPYIKETIRSDAESDCIISGSVSPLSSYCSSSVRQMWVWIHAGALSEGFGALRLACQKQKDETGISVKCFSLDGQLAKLEVMGSNAIQILQKILHPVSGTTGSSLDLMTNSLNGAKLHPQLQRSFILEHAMHLPDHAILSLVVKDPRDLPKKGSKICPEAASYILDADVVKGDHNEHCVSTCSDQYKEIILSSWLNSDSVLYSDSKDLWENHDNINPPVEENLLCTEKHNKRMDFLHLNWNTGITSTEITEQSSRTCPLILLKESNLREAGVRWTIILPLSWVKAFWISLVNHGARAIGLREKRWIAGDVGLPSFPFDFPDCKAYSCCMSDEAIAFDEKMQLRPPAMRPLKVPIQPPWDSVRLAFENNPPSVDDVQILHKEDSGGRENCKSVDDDAGDVNCESKMLERDGCSFKGFIARTSSVLSSHLNEIHGENLPLFPHGHLSKKNKLMKKKDKLVRGPEGNAHLPFDRKLCFVRVLLRAYKEGAFEEGSVVCAPHLTDILLWTSRSDAEEGRLKIPDSFIGSYFKLQSSGKWEIQKPEDPLIRESHRWPIGFVSTGFVRGSKTPSAEAFCEATLLAQLRREQWKGKMGHQKKGEIFVLVRNLRSSAYRLSLATIVLEHQKEDVDYM